MKLKNIYLLIIITMIIFTLFLVSSFNLIINKKEYNNITNNNIKLEIKKIILVGDSRMELMYKSRKELNIPHTIIFDAKSGAKINWFLNNGITNLYKVLENKKYKYYVIFNLGVNDLYYIINIESKVKEYFKLYRNIIINNPNVNFYFLSINPINEKNLKEYFRGNDTRSNAQIEIFNTEMKKRINNKDFERLSYCDSNNSLDFIMPDGLHYDINTNKNILDFIINRCVKINKNYYYNKHTI